MEKKNKKKLSYNNEKTGKGGGRAHEKVYRLIRQLGMTSKYKGYYYVAEAVMMSMELQDYPIKITKDIYPYLAKKFKSTPVNIEHDIRTVINVCWTANKETMDRICKVILFATDHKQ